MADLFSPSLQVLQGSVFCSGNKVQDSFADLSRSSTHDVLPGERLGVMRALLKQANFKLIMC